MTQLETAKKLISKISNLDEADCEAVIVGGAVRDLIMGIDAHDVDIATNCPINIIKKHFTCHDIGQSFKFGITQVTYGDFQFEVANYRKDVDSSDGRHPDSIEITRDLKTDVFRRDFTINALAMNENDEIFDFVGGRDDIKNKIIRFVGDPRARVKEDYLRMLRALRFAARFDFHIEEHSFKAIRENAFFIQSIAKERIKQELFKTASYGGKELARFIELADEVKLLTFILPELTMMKDDKHQPKHHPEGAIVQQIDHFDRSATADEISLVDYEHYFDVTVTDFDNHNIVLIREGTVYDHVIAAVKSSDSTDPMVNLSILLHDIGKPFEKRFHVEKGYDIYHGHDQRSEEVIAIIGKRLAFSKHEIDAFTFAALHHMVFYDLPSMRLSRAAKILESEHFELLRLTCLGDSLATSRKSDLDRFYEIDDKLDCIREKIHLKAAEGQVSPLRKIINGELVMKLTALKPGKEVGRIITETFEWATDNEVSSIDEIEKHIIEMSNGTIHQS